MEAQRQGLAAARRHLRPAAGDGDLHRIPYRDRQRCRHGGDLCRTDPAGGHRAVPLRSGRAGRSAVFRPAQELSDALFAACTV